jgi:flagellar basal body rod protein FlgG
MPKLTYVAASAMQVEATALDLAARNLAHVTTAGYRREVFLYGSFNDTMRRQGKTGEIDGNGGAGVHNTNSYFVHRPGQQVQTDAPLDVSLGSDTGYFRATAPDGRTLLSRAGHFQLDRGGRVVTPDGWPVHGQGGPITVPRNAERIMIDRTGRISALVREGGQATEQFVDQLRIARIDRPAALTPVNGQWFDPGDTAPPDLANPEIRQGYQEQSNVEPVQELANMIAIQRRYDAAQKALRETTNLGGNVSELLRGTS